ncbi:MAG: hypothetical protein IPM83_16445 [Ignavibacteria bacterium]|nr:hypothetical protein [Ignavibacteria bacterium]
MTTFVRSTILLVVFAGVNVTLGAQELDPTVNVNMDPLTQDQRRDVLPWPQR